MALHNLAPAHLLAHHSPGTHAVSDPHTNQVVPVSDFCPWLSFNLEWSFLPPFCLASSLHSSLSSDVTIPKRTSITWPLSPQFLSLPWHHSHMFYFSHYIINKNYFINLFLYTFIICLFHLNANSMTVDTFSILFILISYFLLILFYFFIII